MTATAAAPRFLGEEQDSLLEAFARALSREAHNLTRRPDLLWQQLYNRLQWADASASELLDAERERRSASPTAFWLRMKTGFRESAALVRELPGHDKYVLACAFSPDGSRLASASLDGTLKLWDPGSGQARATLAGHGGGVTACAFSPDGSLLASASWDGTLKLWDSASGRERATLAGHGDWVTACAFSPDGSRLASASWDRTLKLWGFASGEERATLPCVGGAVCVALHPGHPLAAYGDSVGGVYLVELAGVQYGPIVVTAVDRGGGSTVRCLACFEELPLEESWLGQAIECPRRGCEGRMRVNSFVVRRPQRRRRWALWRQR